MAKLLRGTIFLGVLALVIVSLTFQTMDVFSPPAPSLVDESKLQPFKEPVINGPMRHKICVTVLDHTTVFNVWAHRKCGAPRRCRVVACPY